MSLIIFLGLFSIILFLFHQLNFLLYLKILLLDNLIYLNILILIILLFNLQIYLRKVNFKYINNYVGGKFIYFVFISFKYLLFALVIVCIFFITTSLVKVHDLHKSIKIYDQYDQYATTIFSYNHNDPSEDVDQARSLLYKETVDRYNGLLIDSRKLVSNNQYCSENPYYNTVYCNLIDVNQNYLEEMEIKDMQGNRVEQDLEDDQENFLMPVCHKDEIKDDLGDLYKPDKVNIIDIPCNQEYLTFNRDVYINPQTFMESGYVAIDPLVHVLHDQDINYLVGDNKGLYFIDISEEEFNQLIIDLNIEKYINEYELKNDSVYQYIDLLEKLIVLLIIVLISIIMLLFYVNNMVIDISIFRKKKKITIKYYFGYSNFQIFKNEILLDLLFKIVSFMLVMILSLYNFNWLFIAIYIIIIIIDIIMFKQKTNIRKVIHE